MKTLLKILAVILALGVAVGCFCLESYLFMLLVNWLASTFAFDLALTFAQSCGIVLLLSFIGGFFKIKIKVKAE